MLHTGSRAVLPSLLNPSTAPHTANDPDVYGLWPDGL